MNITTRALHLADAAVALAKVSTTRADDIKLYDEALTVIREAKQLQFTNQCGETCERATLCIGCSKQLTEADRNYQPEKQEWVDLTDDELNEIYEQFHDSWGHCEKDGYEEAVIAAFKAKNNL